MKGNTVPLPVGAPIIGVVYQHYKGDQYKISALALHANDEVWMVVYEPLSKNPVAPFFTRRVAEWFEVVTWDGGLRPRFTRVDTAL